jgi:N-acetylglucosaminyl-diphospho-decaprenol L-rhamnosyltransferase
MQLDLTIVIVNYNTRELLRDCLHSIFASHRDFACQVCVVDNNSSDGSAALVQETFPQVRLIESRVNGGYAYANNLGLRAMGFDAHQLPDSNSCNYPRYILLLNPDTVLPPSALQEMLAFMDAHPEAGAAGPRLVLPDGQLDRACRRSFPTPEVAFYRLTGLSFLFPRSPRFGRYNLSFRDPDETVEVDSVVGAFMMARGEAVQQVGLLDENFFMYGEDLDWAYRIKQAGWKIYYNADVTVLHYKEAASKGNRVIRPKTRYEFYRAMHLFYRKHYAATTPFWLRALVLIGLILRGGVAILSEGLKSLMAKRATSQDGRGL